MYNMKGFFVFIILVVFFLIVYSVWGIDFSPPASDKSYLGLGLDYNPE